MKVLSNNEINQVAGANLENFREDIITTAATIYVGTAIGSAASSLCAATFAGASSLLGTAATTPLGFTVGAVGSIISPVMFFAAPVMVFDALYPGVLAEKLAPYFN